MWWGMALGLQIDKMISEFGEKCRPPGVLAVVQNLQLDLRRIVNSVR